jgi:nucleoside phosphorylase
MDRMTTDTIARDLITAPVPELSRSKLVPIPWPAGLAPVAVDLAGDGTGALPACDVVIVTWTTAEATALADVLSPGVELADWTRYTFGYQDLLPSIRKGAPAYEEHDLARFYGCKIADKRVLLMKSDLHMSQDGPDLPVRALWKKIILETGAKLVLTTGTAGGVGDDIYLGDVIVTDTVRFDCQKEFKGQSFANSTYVAKRTAEVERDISELTDVNAARLPTADHADGHVTEMPGVVLTTDFFAFDDAEDTYGLRVYEPAAAAVEMGDAVLGLVCAEDIPEGSVPAWAAVRNASDPQMPKGATVEDEANAAAKIYLDWGYVTTIGSAIACWAIVVDAKLG